MAWSYFGAVFVIFHALVLFLSSPVESGAVQLDSINFDQILANNELVFVNFYADWCRFSNMLAPTWDETADKVSEAFPVGGGKVVIGKVDCDTQGAIASRFHITKYPTLKLLHNGQVSKKEYRGQRSVEAFTAFVTEQLTDPVKTIVSLEDISAMEEKKRRVIGYFDSAELTEVAVFRKVAANLKEECHFAIGYGDAVKSIHPPGESLVTFSAALSKEEETFSGSLISYDEVLNWATERCVPFVREITFQNAEELTEEGLPFLILFHAPDDTTSTKKYEEVVRRELMTEKQSINFLTADGEQFKHPLHHLGKDIKDLPIIAIDSFRHMYLFPDFKDMNRPGRLKNFLADLHSGKLHREFHYGPDSVVVGDDTTQQLNSDGPEEQRHPGPLESTFKKLAPSKNRYTLLDKDEL